MPARLLRVHLINDTDFPLDRAQGHSLQGEFTSSDWTPPERIQPRSQGAWQSESDGLFQGTEGWETYEINDESRINDRVRLHWDNPFWGRTTAHVLLLEPTGFFDDRKEAEHQDPDPGKDTPEHSLSAKFRAEVLLPLPMSQYPDADAFTASHPGYLNTDGWLEIVPGTHLTLPLPLGPIDHAWVAYRVSLKSDPPTPSFGQTTKAQGLVFVPAVDAPPEAWEGTFVYPSGEVGGAQVFLDIEGSGGKLALARLRGVSYHVVLSERSGLRQVAPISIDQDSIVESPAEAVVYRHDTWPPQTPYLSGVLSGPGGDQTGRGAPWPSLSLSPAAALDHAVVRVDQARLRGAARSTARQGAAAGPASPVSGSPASLTLAQHLAQQSLGVSLLDQADGLTLPFNITLMLYSAHFEDGQPVGYSVRYVRRHTDGTRLADVMLLPVLQTIA